jgi:hypothetical protein
MTKKEKEKLFKNAMEKLFEDYGIIPRKKEKAKE